LNCKYITQRDLLKSDVTLGIYNDNYICTEQLQEIASLKY